MEKNVMTGVWVIFLVFAGFFLIFGVLAPKTSVDPRSLEQRDLFGLVRHGAIESVTYQGDRLKVKARGDRIYHVYLSQDEALQEELTTLLEEHQIQIFRDSVPPGLMGKLGGMLAFLVPIGLFVAIVLTIKRERQNRAG
jgi:hypothetical protein